MQSPFDSKHIVRQSQSAVSALAAPLFKRLGLNYFHFFRAYKDGTFIALYSRMDWHDHFFEKNYRPTIPLQSRQCDSIQLGAQYISLWEGVVNDCITQDARHLFDLANPLAINKVMPDYMDSFAFAGSASESNLINTYFSNLDTLLAFTEDFYDKAASLLDAAIRQKITFLKQTRPHQIDLLFDLVKSLNIMGQHGWVKLTYKEYEILQFLLGGLSANEIAVMLDRSPRTIESHLVSLKSKLGCQKRSGLFNVALRNGIKPKTFQKIVI